MGGDGGWCGSVGAPGAELVVEACGEVVAGAAVADGTEFHPAGGGVVVGEAAVGEVGEGVAFGDGGAACGDGRGAEAGCDRGGPGGDAAGARFGGGEA